MRLGYGNRPSLSADGKRVVCIRQEAGGTHLVILPTGAGDSRVLDFGDKHYERVEWFPDGKKILFTANERGRPIRAWTFPLEDGSSQPTPITAEGVRATAPAPDGRHVVRVQGKHLSVMSADGTTASPFVDLEPGEIVTRWSADGRYLFLRKPKGNVIEFSRLDATTHRREPWRTLHVPEPGATFIGTAALSADGKASAASFQQDIANLYLVKGLK